MAGNSAGGRPTSPTRTPAASSRGKEKPQGPCEQDFQAPLTGVKAATLNKVNATSELDVALVSEGDFVTVVCRLPGTNQVVGSLAAFRGVRELIKCLEQGFEYVARVVNVSTTQVDVHVRRKNT